MRHYSKLELFFRKLRNLKDELVLEDGWSSYDRTPWMYPWLTTENLEKFEYYSDSHRQQLVNRLESNATDQHYAVYGNMANSMYTRAAVLRQKGVQCDVLLHPQDNFIMSHPFWEEYDGDLQVESRDYHELVAEGVIKKSSIEGVFQYGNIGEMPSIEACAELGISAEDYEAFSPFMLNYETYKHLDGLSASICAHSLYFGYLNSSPYAAVSLGGDLWFEASRSDAFGYLQRAGFSNANYILASDPLTIASCRRYGFKNAIYIPHYLDQQFYSPGESSQKQKIVSQHGGDFNIFSTGRLDVSTKGSNIAAGAIVEFLQKHKNARLMQMAWGNDLETMKDWFASNGVADQVVWLPLSGKKRLVEYLRMADCFVGQFVLGAYGHADLEAMACAVPVIGYIDPTSYGVLCPTGMPPIINTKESKGVLDGLEKLIADRQYAKGLGANLRAWFEANHGSEKWYIDHLAILQDMTKTGRKIHINPALKKGLSMIEKRYLAEQMMKAPEFPNYEVGSIFS